METTANPSRLMKHIEQHLFHLKTHQIVDYYPHFWMKNALFSVCSKSHWVNAVVSYDLKFFGTSLARFQNGQGPFFACDAKCID